MKVLWIVSFFLLTCMGCLADDKAHITLIQINDVYELMPLSGTHGSEGGLAKVATIIKQQKKENPHTIALLAGDFLSPSALGLAFVPAEGGGKEKLAGRQMVDTLNAMGLDCATFGNHEFDLDEASLLKRIGESKFAWISSNVLRKGGAFFPEVLTYKILTFKDGENHVRLGIYGITLDANQVDYAEYRNDYLAVSRDMASALEALGAEIVLGLTHLSFDSDVALAQGTQGLDLILGGHEHENVQVWRGPNLVPIFKADANARTVYIHHLDFDYKTRKLEIHSELKYVDENVPDDPEVKKVVDHWVQLAYDGFRAQGLDPATKVAVAKIDLDGREASVRNGETVLTRMLSDSMLMPDCQGSIYNGGSIRIDDVIYKGQTITMYDVLRILPFGGFQVRAEIKGALLVKALEQGLVNKGTGGFLQRGNFGGISGAWTLNGAPIDPNARYKIVFNDFVLQGKEAGLGFLKVLEPIKVDGKSSYKITNTDELVVLDKIESWPDLRLKLADQLKKEGLPAK